MSPSLKIAPDAADISPAPSAPTSGDQIAALYREHAGSLLAYVTRLTNGDYQWAEDVVQETLLRAWRNPVSVCDSRPPIRAWLFTVAKHIVIDGYRRRAVRPAETSTEHLAAVGQPDEVERTVLSITVAEAMSTLTAEHQDVLRELYFRDNCVEQTSAVLRIPRGTVRSRTFYALRALRRAMEEQEVDGDVAA